MFMLTREILQIFRIGLNQFGFTLQNLHLKNRKREKKGLKKRLRGSTSAQDKFWPTTHLSIPEPVASLSLSALTSGPHQRCHRLHHPSLPNFRRRKPWPGRSPRLKFGDSIPKSPTSPRL
jgi:hypothetical protein